MKRKLLIILMLLLTIVTVKAQHSTSIYDYKLTDINGKTFDMSELKGKKMLLVNTATHCSLTPQFNDMVRLSKDYKDDLVVVAIPSNDFGDKEPGSNEEIKKFVEEHKVTFPVMAKPL